MAFLEIKNVSRELVDNDNKKLKIINNVNFSVEKGEFLSIIGPSGCGKTTLLRLISGLSQPEEGEIKLFGKKITGPSVSKGYVFQHGSLYPWETIEQNISAGLEATQGKGFDKSLVKHFIEIMGLQGFENSYPNQVSGGMAQRAALARSLILKPNLLLLDEPMGALDAFTRADVQNIVYRLWKDTETTMILVTHDIDEAIYLGQRILVMTPHPGEVKEIVDNKLSFPRERNSKEFLEQRRKLQEILSFE
ncbi:ABC transporter ATP-binding protein [Liquorilactobacillus vini]|uniref:ABC transporter ATP-binding protein n=1 Tax=Liquorilactobacillus vini TaxID=238015 RepID=UPI000317812B|nr:ABC transporter ATP-binding protein [Liquorilactobacillus vini]